MHPILTFSSLPLFLGALLSDWAYASSAQVQWTNFADWLNVGGLVLAGVALLWALLAALRDSRQHQDRPWLSVALLTISVVLGVANALIHAKDGWAAMPAAPILSLLVFVAAAFAAAVGLAALNRKVDA